MWRDFLFGCQILYSEMNLHFIPLCTSLLLLCLWFASLSHFPVPPPLPPRYLILMPLSLGPYFNQTTIEVEGKIKRWLRLFLLTRPPDVVSKLPSSSSSFYSSLWCSVRPPFAFIYFPPSFSFHFVSFPLVCPCLWLFHTLAFLKIFLLFPLCWKEETGPMVYSYRHSELQNGHCDFVFTWWQMLECSMKVLCSFYYYLNSIYVLQASWDHKGSNKSINGPVTSPYRLCSGLVTLPFISTNKGIILTEGLGIKRSHCICDYFLCWSCVPRVRRNS